jgi:hypothetical protein
MGGGGINISLFGPVHQRNVFLFLAQSFHRCQEKKLRGPSSAVSKPIESFRKILDSLSAANVEEHQVDGVEEMNMTVYDYKMSKQEWRELDHGRVKIAPIETGFNMQFGILEFYPGGVRDLHW